MTFQPPAESLSEEDRAARRMAADGAKAAGTPFLSFFMPEEILALARDSGFADVRHVSAGELNRRYFADRADGLATSNGEDFLVATAG
ncbi:hypothetical protein [Amycolatopsis panacis]|uniref:hypothetical protein n=1 Tax=Amycolatopsis panacis TaxID=2340917 RepID=UPI001F427CCC|nr:hypothetical protein [Amycolatopsis panacis]